MKRANGKKRSRMMRINKKSAKSKRIIGRKEMCKKIGVGETTLWRMVKRGDFPPPLQISPRRVGWEEGEGDTYIESRPRAGGTV